jgi:tRNA-modifying protein YgfZ
VEIADRTAERGLMSLIGPAARDLAAEALGAAVPGNEAPEHSLVESDSLLVVATDTGLDLIGPREALERAAEALVSAGAEPAGPEAAEIVRIESGRPRLGADMSEDNFPGEAGIVERAVSFTKGCYVGQEPVARMFHRGHPNRHLRGLKLAAPVEPGTSLFAGGREVGHVTSASTSPALGPLALAMVRREVEPGAEVTLGEDGPSSPVVELPFERS